NSRASPNNNTRSTPASDARSLRSDMQPLRLVCRRARWQGGDLRPRPDRAIDWRRDGLSGISNALHGSVAPRGERDPMSSRNLDLAVRPRSLAVIGASTREGSVGRVVIDNIVKGGFEGTVWPVNPKYRQVC